LQLGHLKRLSLAPGVQHLQEELEQVSAGAGQDGLHPAGGEGVGFKSNKEGLGLIAKALPNP